MSDAHEAASKTGKDAPRSMRSRAWMLVALTLIATLAALVASTAGPDLRDTRAPSRVYAAAAFYLQTFRFHVGLVALAMAALLAFKRRRFIAALLLVAAIVGVAPEARHAWPRRDDLPATGTLFRLVGLNNYQIADNVDRVAAMARRESPDAIAFGEFWDDCDDALAARIGDLYPYRATYPGPTSAGIGLYSKWPITAVSPLADGDGLRRFFEATLDVDGRAVRVVVAHFTSPQGIDAIARNRRAVAACADRVRGATVPTLVVGDLNFPFHSPQADAFRAAGLAHADDRAGRGFRWTWMPARSFPITRIDHAFVTPHFAVSDSRVLADVGSDHRPIAVNLVLRPAVP